MVTARDRVWAGVLRVTNERAGFSVDKLSEVCDEMYGEDAPSVETINDTVSVMVELGVLKAFDDGDSAHYVANTDLSEF